MAFVITEACKGVLDRGCVDACPVDCIYEGDGILTIRADECIDCQACMGVCPVQAIYPAAELPDSLKHWIEYSTRWFEQHPDAPVATRSFASGNE